MRTLHRSGVRYVRGTIRFARHFCTHRFADDCRRAVMAYGACCLQIGRGYRITSDHGKTCHGSYRRMKKSRLPAGVAPTPQVCCCPGGSANAPLWANLPLLSRKKAPIGVCQAQGWALLLKPWVIVLKAWVIVLKAWAKIPRPWGMTTPSLGKITLIGVKLPKVGVRLPRRCSPCAKSLTWRARRCSPRPRRISPCAFRFSPFARRWGATTPSLGKNSPTLGKDCPTLGCDCLTDQSKSPSFG